jgi:hypothetical protein
VIHESRLAGIPSSGIATAAMLDNKIQENNVVGRHTLHKKMTGRAEVVFTSRKI